MDSLEPCFLHWASRHHRKAEASGVDEMFERVSANDDGKSASEHGEPELQDWRRRYVVEGETRGVKQQQLRLAFCRGDEWVFWSFCRGAM